MEDLISVFSNNMPEFMLANWELRSFSLENNWLTHKEFLQKAQEWWAKQDIHGFTGSRVFKKLQSLKVQD